MIGARIRRARKAKGLSLEKLALKVGNITKQSINKYELGKATPSSDILLRIARVLDVKVEYFFRPFEVKLEKVNFRRKAKLSITEENRIKEISLDHLERYLMLEELLSAREITTKPFKKLGFPIKQSIDTEEAAIKLRENWNLGLDPIENLTELLEEQGIKVIEVNGSNKFDGLSGLVDSKYAFIAIGSNWPGERQRFTLAHELGHLILDISPDCESKNRETCCHRFAAAFLVPRETAISELGPRRNYIPYQELILLKNKYGLSINAWIMRAFDLEVITESRKSRYFKDLSQRGWRKNEPHELPPERPARFKRLLLHALAEKVISESKASDILSVKTGELWPKINEWTNQSSPA
jgi:Zn-dependent peptidase ImmA (M78 family)/DNA-binding XRE family transcriptional regulator